MLGEKKPPSPNATQFPRAGGNDNSLDAAHPPTVLGERHFERHLDCLRSFGDTGSHCERLAHRDQVSQAHRRPRVRCGPPAHGLYTRDTVMTQ
jgi:hypothetical protein